MDLVREFDARQALLPPIKRRRGKGARKAAPEAKKVKAYDAANNPAVALPVRRQQKIVVVTTKTLTKLDTGELGVKRSTSPNAVENRHLATEYCCCCCRDSQLARFFT